MNSLLNTLVLCIEGFWRQLLMVFFSDVLRSSLEIEFWRF